MEALYGKVYYHGGDVYVLWSWKVPEMLQKRKHIPRGSLTVVISCLHITVVHLL